MASILTPPGHCAAQLALIAAQFGSLQFSVEAPDADLQVGPAASPGWRNQPAAANAAATCNTSALPHSRPSSPHAPPPPCRSRC